MDNDEAFLGGVYLLFSLYDFASYLEIPYKFEHPLCLNQVSQVQVDSTSFCTLTQFNERQLFQALA